MTPASDRPLSTPGRPGVVGKDLKHVRLPDTARLWQLPGAGLGWLRLLMVGFKDPSFNPVEHEEWIAWQRAPRRWGPLFPRAAVRELPQEDRAWASLGLSPTLRVQPSRDPLLDDLGPLARACGVDWEAGVAALLACLALEPAETGLPIVSKAVLHAIACEAPASLCALVLFAHDAGWSGKDLGLSGADVARGWALLLGDEGPLMEDDVALDRLLSISALRPGNEEEVSFWKTLVSQGKEGSANALEAWVSRYPASWDRLHEQALLSPEVPGAWLVACRHAHRRGVETPLFQAALASATAPLWLNRLGWGPDPEGSPLAAWWSHWVDIEQERAAIDDDYRVPIPGLDAVSMALRRAGAPEPGSAQDRSLGGKCFAALLPARHANPEWFASRPDWLYPHPRTRSTPLFQSRSWAEFEQWTRVGFDPRGVNSKGENAAACFLASCSGNPRRLPAQVRAALESGALPPVGQAVGQPMVARIARMGEDALYAWLDARKIEGGPFSPEETYHLARRASAFIVRAWQVECLSRGQWSSEHGRALWISLAFRDTAEDADAWQEVMNDCPLQEHSTDPLWPSLLDAPESTEDIGAALLFLHSHGAALPSSGHPIWDREDVNAWMGEDVLSRAPATRRVLIPQDADDAWWLARLRVWLQSEAHRTAQQIDQWIAAGLPMHGAIVELLAKQEKPEPFSLLPWWKNEAVSAALQAADLHQSAPPASSSRSRRL